MDVQASGDILGMIKSSNTVGSGFSTEMILETMP